MKRKYTLTILIILVLSITLSACAGSSSMVATGWAGITADEETAYVAFNTHVVAVNLASGTERWRFPAEPDPKISFYASPALTESGNLVAGSYNNVLYLIDPANGQGKPFFEGANGRYIGGALTAQDMIYAPSADHNLYAVDQNGAQKWVLETGEPLWARPATDLNCSCIYVASMDHKVYAVESQSGTVLWITEDLGGSIVGTPVVSDDMKLYVGTFAKEMVAVDAQSGDELWRFAANDWIWAGATVADDTLYFGDLSGTFYALDRTTGTSKWQIQPGGPIVGKPLVTDEGIYFTTEDGSLVSVSPEGAIRWNQPYEIQMYAGPIGVGDMILVATSDPENLLIAVDLNGVQKWVFSLGK